MPFPAFFLLSAALGGREALRNRRGKKRALDIEAERIDQINNIDLGINAQGRESKFDARQIEVMQRQFQTAQALMRSPNQQQQALGINMIQDLDSAVRANIQQNETEARADKVREQDQEIVATALTKGDNEQRLARELVMNRQLRTELAAGREAEVLQSKVSNALLNGDITGSQIALTAMIQAIDGSVVRARELRNYQSTNGAINFMVNALNKLEGGDFTEQTKVSIRNGIAALTNAERTRSMALTESFQARAVAFGLDPKRVLAGIDTNLFTPLPINREAQEALEAKADAAEAAFAEGRFEEIDPNLATKVSAAAISGSREILSSIRRQLTGAKLIRNDKGELFEQAPDGTLTSVGRDDLFKTEDGRILRLVDRGNGRFEWVVVEDASDARSQRLEAIGARR